MANPFKHFIFKVANMRSEQRFIIYPYAGGDECTLQSDKRFCRLNLRTGKGIINAKNQNHANSISLAMHPIEFVMPDKVLTQIKSYLWNNSGVISNGILHIENKELYSI